MSDIRYKALLVGNSEFPNDPHNLMTLKGPPNDVIVLRDALTHNELGLHRAEDVTVLLNQSSRDIMVKLEEFFGNSSRDDQLLFYYSGHGYLNLSSQLFLCASDTITKSLISTAIPDTNINAMVQNSISNRVMIVLDCCNSGNFKGGELPQNLKGEGRFVITSSRAGQLSTDTPEMDGPSAFTKYLVEALVDGDVDVNKDGYVGINEVYEYVFPRLMAETKQIPHRHFDKTIGDLAFGRRPLAIPREKPRKVSLNVGQGRPHLNVSETNIEIRHVQPDEQLPDEIIDVYNEGAGELDWTASCDADWIEMETDDNFIKLRFTPKPGPNRANIRVSEKGGGGSKTIRVFVEVQREETRGHEPARRTTEPIPAAPESSSRVLAKFEMTVRNPEYISTPLAMSDREGLLIVRKDNIEFTSKKNIITSSLKLDRNLTLRDIVSIEYLDKDQNSALTYNYIRVNYVEAGQPAAMLFYKFSLHETNPTRKIFDAIDELIRSGQLKVSSPALPHTTPPPVAAAVTSFQPGRWNVQISNFGQVTATLDLAFEAQGVLHGTQQAYGATNQVQGTWGYDMGTRILAVYVQIMAGGMPMQDAVQIQMGDAQGGVIRGFDQNGQQYAFSKV